MFNRIIFQFFKACSFIVLLSPWVVGAYDPSDTRNQLISKIRNEFSWQITARQRVLGTSYDSVALVDIAREKLESGILNASDPDWSLVIRYVLLGYGYSRGVDPSLKASNAEVSICKLAYGYSSTYLTDQGLDGPARVEHVNTQSPSSPSIAGHVQALNQAAASAPAKVLNRVKTAVINPVTYNPSDARNLLVSNVRRRFSQEIATRQRLLGTQYDSVALVDIAREKLENGAFTPGDPDWSLVIRYVLLGHGYSRGVDSSLKASESEQEIFKLGYGLSYGYRIAMRCQEPTFVSQVNTQSSSWSPIATHVRVLNQVAAIVPNEVVFQASALLKSHHRYQNQDKGQGQDQDLRQLSRFNAWFAHERFWAAGGVIDPRVPELLKVAYAKRGGNQLSFLKSLYDQLDAAMRAISGTPTPQAVEDLVRNAQQILLTIAAGTPNDNSYTRLSPGTSYEWESIRKALFLALSVTSDPEKSGRSFVSTLYDTAKYHHKKTDANRIKEYYWKLEAYAVGFSTLWKGFKEAQTDRTIQNQLNERIAKADPIYDYLKISMTPKTEYRCNESSVYMASST